MLIKLLAILQQKACRDRSVRSHEILGGRLSTGQNETSTTFLTHESIGAHLVDGTGTFVIDMAFLKTWNYNTKQEQKLDETFRRGSRNRQQWYGFACCEALRSR